MLETLRHPPDLPLQSGSPLLESCDISSRSGSGVGVEGARRPRLKTCRVHACAGHGVAVYGAVETATDDDYGKRRQVSLGGFRSDASLLIWFLMPYPQDANALRVLDGTAARGGLANVTAPELIECEVDGNRLNGILARAGTAARVERCRIHDNGEYGVRLLVSRPASLSPLLMMKLPLLSSSHAHYIAVEFASNTRRTLEGSTAETASPTMAKGLSCLHPSAVCPSWWILETSRRII